MMTATNLESDLKRIRARGVPLVAIRTLDPGATAEMIVERLGAYESDDGAEIQVAIIGWDVVSGLWGYNSLGKEALGPICEGEDPLNFTSPSGALCCMQKAPRDCIAVFHNLQRVLNDTGVAQAIWNLRDTNKRLGRTLICLVPDVTLPGELQNDMLVLDEPLPTEAELRGIVLGVYADSELAEPDSEALMHAVDALLGLNAFSAEQATALSMTGGGVNLGRLWERKRQMVEQVQGLTVWRGDETLADVAGYDNAKEDFLATLLGDEPPRVVFFIDELDKAVGIDGGNDGGVSQGIKGKLLTWMEDRQVDAYLLMGIPGAGKSFMAKGCGGSAGIPTIQADINGVKAGIVGESEQNFRQVLKVVDAVGQGRILVIATCNSMANLAPELRRRFTLGTFFFDLPNATEGAALWAKYTAQYGVEPPSQLPEGWTGAEVRNACRRAKRQHKTIAESMAYIVPVKQSMASQLSRLRQEASGAYISASYPGAYDAERKETGARRIMRIEGREN